MRSDNRQKKFGEKKGNSIGNSFDVCHGRSLALPLHFPRNPSCWPDFFILMTFACQVHSTVLNSFKAHISRWSYNPLLAFWHESQRPTMVRGSPIWRIIVNKKIVSKARVKSRERWKERNQEREKEREIWLRLLFRPVSILFCKRRPKIVRGRNNKKKKEWKKQ